MVRNARGIGRRIGRTRGALVDDPEPTHLARKLAHQVVAALARLRTTMNDYYDKPDTHSDTYCRADMMVYRVTLHS